MKGKSRELKMVGKEKERTGLKRRRRGKRGR